MKPVLSDRLVYQDETTSDTLHHRPYIGVARPTVVIRMTRLRAWNMHGVNACLILHTPPHSQPG
jgi:hypothetical protein